MKFCDKLIALRKKHGLSQEELASKLNVSRQSVSKWESGNAYPETDKIISIANLFDCSMDDLINDNITDLNSMERKTKNSFNTSIDSFLDFITKTINMFCDMKFTNGFKCLIEMVVLGFLLFCLGSIITAIFTHVIGSLFTFLPSDIYTVIKDVIKAILNVLWFIISVIVLVHIFKNRYLDYYEKSNEEKVKEKFTHEKKEKIIIRDEEHKPFAFLELLSKIVIGFIKLIAAWFFLTGMFSLIGLTAGLIISCSMFVFNLLFIGADIALICLITLNILVLLLLFNFIFNKSSNFKIIFIIGISSVVLFGAGCGMTAIGFKDYTITNSMNGLNTVTNSTNIDFDDNMIIHNWYDSIEYIIDNNIDDIKIEYSSNNEMSNVVDNYYKDGDYKIYYLSYDSNVSLDKLYRVIRKDLKNKTIRAYNFDFFNIKVYGNENNVNKIIDNTKKLYNYDIKKTNKGYIIKDLEHYNEDEIVK